MATDPISPSGEEPLPELIRRIRPRLGSILHRFQIPPEDAEDLLQETVLILLYKQKRVRDREAWLLVTLRNQCIMYWRKRRSRPLEPAEEELLEALMPPDHPAQTRRELLLDLERLLEQLPPRCRAVLRLRYSLGYGPSEAAEVLGYQPSSMSKITNRCLSALADQLAASTGERPATAGVTDTD